MTAAHQALDTGIVEIDTFGHGETARALAIEAWRELCSRGASRAVVMCGPPGAGKSTWIANNREPGCIYYDATLTWPQTRAWVTKIARDAGLEVEIIVMDTSLADCLWRNAGRSSERRVPDDQIARQHEELRTKPPTTHPWLTIRRVTGG